MVKLKVRNIILIMLLIIMMFTLSACASARAMVVTNVDNTIDELINIELDDVAILTAGESVQEVKDNIYIESVNEAEKMCEYLNNKIDAQILMGVTGETVDTLISYKNGMEVVKSEWKDNSFTIGVRFKNIDVYRYYYGIEENSKVEYQKEEHFFYTKMYYQAYTIYVRHSDLHARMFEKYSTQYPNLIKSPTNQLLYTYTTESRREHSNADYVNNIGGIYYHTWKVDGNNLLEPITIYYNVANAGNCILVCIIISLSVTLILLLVSMIIIIIKKRKNKKIQ